MKVDQLIPELLVEDMSKTLDFYQGVLGFEVEILFPGSKPIFAQLGKDEAHMMFYQREDFQKEITKIKKLEMGGTVLIYFKVIGINSFYNKIKDKVKIVQPIHKTDYGKTQFAIEDCNGYLLAFSEDSK